MGCSEGKTSGDERPGLQTKNIFPTCLKSIELGKKIDSMVVHDSNQIFLGANDGLQLLDIKTDNVSLFSNEHKGRINTMIKLEDGRIATGGQDKAIKIWNMDSKESLMTLEGHTSMIWTLSEIKGNKLISGGSDKRALIWDLNEKKLDFELYKDKEISVVLYLKNGNVLICSENTLILFDLNSKEKLSSIEIPTGIWAIKELHDGTVAIGKGNGEICILNIGREITIKMTLVGHKKSVNSIIELDNHKLVTAADEFNMILWNLNDPDAKYFIEGHTKNVTCVAHLVGNKFVSVSTDQTLKIWE